MVFATGREELCLAATSACGELGQLRISTHAIDHIDVFALIVTGNFLRRRWAKHTEAGVF